MAVTSLTGKQFYLVEVIAFILKKLKSLLMNRIESLILTTIIPEDIHWAITVPAIWRPEGKQLMREAACLVRLYVNIYVLYT